MPKKYNTPHRSMTVKTRLTKLARCFLPDILAFYESKEGQREFAAWKAQREKERHLQDTKAQ